MLAASSDSGLFDNDRVTNDATLDLLLGGEEGSDLTLFVEGIEVATVILGDEPFVFTTAAQPEGQIRISTQVTDAAGNVSLFSNLLLVTVDLTAPDAPVFGIDAASDTRPFFDGATALQFVRLVGLTEAGARRERGAIRVLRWPFAENDRARAERQIDGLIKVITRPNGRILGAAVVGPQAGELIHPWVLAIAQRLKIGAMAQLIVPYPTLGEVGKRAAGSFYVPKLFSERTRALVRFLARFG